MTVSASLTVDQDQRAMDRAKYPVWEKKAVLVWQTDDGHAAQTVTIPRTNGALENVIVGITEVTGNPTVNVTLTDENGAVLLTLTALADGTVHVKKVATDFDAILLSGGPLTLSVDPSADAGGAGQTLTVTVVLRGL